MQPMTTREHVLLVTLPALGRGLAVGALAAVSVYASWWALTCAPVPPSGVGITMLSAAILGAALGGRL